MDSYRVPSYKAVALAILKNDHTLSSLGFTSKSSKYYKQLKDTMNIKIQTEMF